MGNGEDTHMNCCPSSPSSLTTSSAAAAASLFKSSSTSDQDPFFGSSIWNHPLLHMIGHNPSPNFRPPSLIRQTSSSSHFSDIADHSFGLTQGGAMDEEDSPRGKRKRKESEPPNSVLFNATKKKDVRIDDNSNNSLNQLNKANLPGKQQMSNQAEEIPNNGGEAPKETYSHVRARRGQATNRHSLAERERRERISERMKLLQELVPGCNKITGKAVMLDEIINYVQSLQQQVEFLSMKLATVNPEVNIDIERILSKEMMMHSRGGNTILLPGFARSTNEPLSYLPGIQTGNVANLIPYQHPMMPQNIWDSDFHNLLQMGFDSNQVFHNLGQKGCQKSNL